MKFRQLAGQKFNRLLVIRYLGRTGHDTNWQCKCECGTPCKIRGSFLTTGHTKSCGCLHLQNVRTIHLTHGHAKDGHLTPEYRSWRAMNQRCLDANKSNYKWYGGKGVKICRRWRKFENFLKDMGPRPKGTSISRKRDTGNYEPGNCQWLTKREQGREMSHKYWLSKSK